jgi:MYXO-CTERM domain-containing protein
MKRSTVLAAFGAGLALAAQSVSAAPVQLTSFDNFSLDAIYGSWGAPFATLTSGPTAFTVRSHNYGSGYKYLGGEFNAAGNDTVQVNVTVSEGVAGVLVDLVDASNNGQAYRFYGLTPGNGVNGSNDYVLTMKLTDGQYFTGTGVLDPTRISQMNIEIDPGPTNDFYTAAFNDLSLVSSVVPEPAGLGTAALGGLFLARRRRQRR